jgi:hypothetical protein
MREVITEDTMSKMAAVLVIEHAASIFLTVRNAESA